ncbi:hypothetical protein CIHG_07638 [Coccidioides immitis H538.4]|uniref:Uncharacterized protein n=1 Tax=Coccidioides immitis H538.4 TaxID=396776 RepID=A0A0J8RXR6_COCIT|nr:hypothetical protein CIHG_07638 [Coccidioides immitis H538.4]
MTDLELDDNIIKKIQQILRLVSLKKLVITSKTLLVTQSSVKPSDEISVKPDLEQPLQHADLSENKAFTEITEDNLKTPDNLHKSLQDSALPIRVLIFSTPPIVELEHMNLDNSFLIDLNSLSSSDKTDNNNKKNEAPEDGTQNNNKKIKKSDTNSWKSKSTKYWQEWHLSLKLLAKIVLKDMCKVKKITMQVQKIKDLVCEKNSYKKSSFNLLALLLNLLQSDNYAAKVCKDIKTDIKKFTI